MKAWLILLLLVGCTAADDEAKKEEFILGALKKCSDAMHPSEEDLLQIAKGDLQSNNSKAFITCWFKGAEVMRDKKFQKDEAVTFLRALTPGDPKNDNVPLMKQLVEKCDATVNSAVKGDTAETEVAERIYECLVQEGRKMRLSLDEAGADSGHSTSKA